RTRGDQYDARTTGCAGIAVSHVCRGLFMAHEDVFYPLLAEDRIIDVQCSAARITEDVLHTFVLQRANQHVTAGKMFRHGKNKQREPCPARLRAVLSSCVCEIAAYFCATHDPCQFDPLRPTPR